jgi:putative nucleotidyltransferase with HDIG domain
MYPKKLQAYIAVVGIVAAVILGVSWRFWWQLNEADMVFGAAVFLGSFAAIQMLRGNGSVHMTIPVLLAASVALGPAAGAWLGAFCTWTSRELSGKVRWPSVAFNRAQFGIVGWVGGTLFHALGGSPHHMSLAGISLPLVVAAVAIFWLNLALTSIAINLREERTLVEVFRVYFKWMLPSFWLMLPVGYLMAEVYHLAGAWIELVFLLPLAATRWWLVFIKRYRDMYNQSVHMLLVGLDAKDPYTYGHSMRVGHYAALLARHMKLPEDVVEQVRHAGMLHDIGKMATPDQVLNKKGALDHWEREVIQRHPVLGSAMLTRVQFAGCARDWVLHHHERWDGTGYPDNLCGEEIPLETRIVSIVDAYDAMTSDRPYRRAMTHEDAVREIAAEAGTQFDPKVVEKFLELTREVNLAEAEGAGHGWDRTPAMSAEEIQRLREEEVSAYAIPIPPETSP